MESLLPSLQNLEKIFHFEEFRSRLGDFCLTEPITFRAIFFLEFMEHFETQEELLQN